MMTRHGAKGLAIILAGAVLASGCSQKRVHEEPIIEQGDRVSTENPARELADRRAEADRERLRAERDSIAAVALATCEPEICEAVVRGEVALGMNEAQVMAATGTTGGAWTIRRAGGGAMLTPRSLTDAPEDEVAELALVQLREGRVESYGYRESSGMRLVSEPADATTGGRAAALADRLVREGDELAAAGDLDAALNRYDRADVLRPGSPEVSYKIASVLDKQLRPIQALIQYKLFLHQLELERIEARGEALGHLADAIAQARQRVIILERQTSD